MRVAIVHIRHRSAGGTERHLDQIARHLARNGHAVTIVCRTHEEAPHPAVRFVTRRGPALGSTLRMWAFARAVERHVAETDYDVVYSVGRTWSQDVLRLGGGLVATLQDRAVSAATNPVTRLLARASPKTYLARRIEERALTSRPPPVIIVNADIVRRDLLRRYPAWGERTHEAHVVHNAVDCVRFDARRWQDEAILRRREFGFGDDDHVFLFLGTGYRRKGLATLLEAFARHAIHHPDSRLAVVGYDTSERHYRAMAAGLGVSNLVYFAGGRRDAEACYAAADVYVLPTFDDPFANSTVEALAMGLPVITTHTNGGAERVEEGVTGSIVAAGDPAALADRLDHWSDPARCAAARGPARAEALRFDEDAAMRMVADILEAAARRKGGE